MSAEGALWFFVGALGSGKTSFAFELALEHLLKGGTVVTNIRFYADVIAAWMRTEHGLVFDPARLIYAEDGAEIWKSAVVGTADLPAMLLVDEAHVEHNARAWDKSTAEQVLFNTMARKLKIIVVYITQDINNVDKQFRRMAQRIVYCRNLAHFRIFGIIKCPFNLFIRVPYVCGPGVQPMKQSPEVTMRPLSWGMFDSHSLVGRAQETFGMLKAAEASPLQRVQRPHRDGGWEGLVIAAAMVIGIFL